MLNNKFWHSAVSKERYEDFFFQERDIIESMQHKEMYFPRILLRLCLVTLEPCYEPEQPSELRL